MSEETTFENQSTDCNGNEKTGDTSSCCTPEVPQAEVPQVDANHGVVQQTINRQVQQAAELMQNCSAGSDCCQNEAPAETAPQELTDGPVVIDDPPSDIV